MLKRISKFFGLLVISCSFLFSLVSCNLMGNPYEGIMISAITANNLANGDTELTISFTDEDLEPITFLIPKGKEGNQGETGKPGTGIASITSKDSEDGLSSVLTITYTDKDIEPTSFVVKHGVSVVDITSIQNVSNNTTKVSFVLSDGTTKNVEIPNGKDGIGIESVTSSQDSNGDYIVTITYTGNREPSTIKLPYKNGEDGRGIVSIIGNQEGNQYTMTITYTDGLEDSFSIPLPETTKWLHGNGAPRRFHEMMSNEGDYYFDTENVVIYIFTQGSFNKIIDLKESHTPSETFNVTFDANGGNFVGENPNKITVIAGRPILMSRIPTATLEGKKFIGYYTTPEGPDNPLSGKLTDLTPIYQDLTFYAIYR